MCDYFELILNAKSEFLFKKGLIEFLFQLTIIKRVKFSKLTLMKRLIKTINYL